MDYGLIRQSLSGKNILVTGGTGSFGKAILDEILPYQPAMIRIMSRDEKKQYDMQQAYRDHKNLQYMIGDVRDAVRVREAMREIDIVYHAAALKQVPHCEDAPFEAVRTNILGTENIRLQAIEANIDTVVAISTDKAVKPVNVMGMSKAIQERILLNPHNTGSSSTRFVCVRYGNVLGSRGSVVPLFHQLISNSVPLRFTHPDMTRFQLTLKEAVQLVLWATVNGRNGDLWVRKMPAARVVDLGRALAYGMTGRRDYPEQIIGARPGEKMHEVLVSEEEMWRATELDEHFLIPPHTAPSADAGPKQGPFNEYASSGVQMLTEDQLLEVLESEGWLTRAPLKLKRAA